MTDADRPVQSLRPVRAATGPLGGHTHLNIPEPMGRGQLKGTTTMNDQQPTSQELAIRLILAFIDMHESDNTDRMQLDAVLADMAAGGLERMAGVTMALATRVITQRPIDPDILKGSLRAELARLSDDDGRPQNITTTEDTTTTEEGQDTTTDSPIDVDARDMRRALEVTEGLISAHRGNTGPLRATFRSMSAGEPTRVMTALANLYVSELGDRVGAESVEAKLAEGRAVFTAEGDRLDAADGEGGDDGA